jgi:hypothetical protein
MKNILYALLIVCIFVASCNSDETYEETKITRTALDCLEEKAEGVLSFDSQKQYDELLDSLKDLSHSELLAWESKQPNFTSLYRLRSEALEAIYKVKNIDEYNALVNKYSPYLLFNENDEEDFTAYLPVMDVLQSITLNKNGEVLIAGAIVNKKDFNTYAERQKAIEYTFPQTRATIEDGVNRVYVKRKNRKFTATMSTTNQAQCMQVNAQKKMLWGWVEYTTVYRWRFTPTGEDHAARELSSGSKIYFNPFIPSGQHMYIWTRGVYEENAACMTIQY